MDSVLSSLTGLVHISQITHEKRLEGEDDIKEFLSENQEIWVKVMEVQVCISKCDNKNLKKD